MLTNKEFVLDPSLACELIIQLPQASDEDKNLARGYLRKHGSLTDEKKATLSRHILNLASKLAIAHDPSI